MPKRKFCDDDSDDKVYREFKKLKKMLRRSRRKRKNARESSVSRSSTPSRSNIEDREILEPDMTWLNEIDNSIACDTRASYPPAAQSPADQAPAAQSSAPQPLPSPLTLVAQSSVAQLPATQSPAAEPPTVQTPATATADDVTMPSVYDTLETIQPASLQSSEPELDSIALEILGEDPNLEVKYGTNIQKDVALRLEHISVTGISKDLRKELTTKYLTPANCTLIDPPALNAEIKAAATELVIKRDKAIEFKQKQLASAISCIGEAISRLLTAKDKDTDLLKMLMDASRILCDCQHTDSNTRRSFMLSTLKPDMKAQLQNAKLDKFLFGENLQETIKSAKVINKSGIELKSNVAPRPQQTQGRRPAQSGQNRNLNWRSPLPGRRPPGAPRTREPAPGPSAPNTYRPPPPPPPPPQRQHASSYKTSQYRPMNYRR